MPVIERQEAALTQALRQPYRHGFVTDVEVDALPAGLDEDTVRAISARKREPEFLLRGGWRPSNAGRPWRCRSGAHLQIEPIDFQALCYYSAPKSLQDGPKSLAEVDPKLLETYEKLGVPLHERARLAGVAVDAVFDSVSVGTTFREQLAKAGVIFCSFSHAVQHHTALIERYLGSVVPQGDNYYAALNSAVFSDGSVRLRARRRALPDGAVVVLPHQRTQHRAVRTHVDHCRARQPRQLP